MRFGVYSMRDKLSGFARPTFEMNDPSAMRNFEMAVLNSDVQSVLHAHPEDFDLYRIAYFDSETGSMISCEIERIASGQQIYLHSLKGADSDGKV